MNRFHLARGDRVQTMILYVKRGYDGNEATCWFNTVVDEVKPVTEKVHIKDSASCGRLFRVNFRVKKTENEKGICGKLHSSVTRNLMYYKATTRKAVSEAAYSGTVIFQVTCNSSFDNLVTVSVRLGDIYSNDAASYDKLNLDQLNVDHAVQQNIIRTKPYEKHSIRFSASTNKLGRHIWRLYFSNTTVTRGTGSSDLSRRWPFLMDTTFHRVRQLDGKLFVASSTDIFITFLAAFDQLSIHSPSYLRPINPSNRIARNWRDKLTCKLRRC
ncbi:hypothetical protein CLF_109155 [Clonorchis sinensis]|uniref:Uncharacterized protein n=1 Tax=Clonorchis sinensis TaxID=79923 RepID=G7YJ05_CLOSI|nr:hypothetical protein CLF_109155 [Clonorchis sinensis]